MRIRSMLPTVWGEQGAEREPFRVLQNEIDRVFGDFMSGVPALSRWNGDGRLAVNIDVAETDKAIEVNAELPGVEEKDIDVTLTGDVLTIRGEKKSEKDEKTKDYRLVERSYGSFSRSMRLPFQTDPGKVEATFNKGVLKVTVPKPAEAQTRQQKIAVKAAA